MFSFPSRPRESLSPELQQQWDRSVERRGEAKFVAAAAHAPEIFQWYSERFYGDLFYRGRVASRYKELGRLRLSTLHGCRSCNRGNRLDAIEAGISEAQINAIDDVAGGPFDDAERAVLKLAQVIAITAPDGRLDEPLYNELREHFDDAQIFEMGFVFGMLAGVAKFLFVYDIAEKEDYCPFGNAAE